MSRSGIRGAWYRSVDDKRGIKRVVGYIMWDELGTDKRGIKRRVINKRGIISMLRLYVWDIHGGINVG